MDSRSVPFVLMRGGTSKGVFLHARDVPERGAALNALLLGIMGSPDPMQIDGLGGTYSSTSKVVIVDVIDGVVEYRFAQVGVDAPVVDWSGNCGNLTTAVAPFAVDEGLVDVASGAATVALRNVNTGVRIDAELLVEHGRAVVAGDLAIAGVPGTGSPITTRYVDPAPDGALAVGSPTMRLRTAHDDVEASIVAVTHPYVVVEAEAMGMPTTPAEANADAVLLERVESLRDAAAEAMRAAGFGDPSVEGPAWPRIAFASPSPSVEADLHLLTFSMGTAHRALPMTAALCVAAATRIPGTIPHRLAPSAAPRVRVAHPRGVAAVEVDLSADGAIAAVGVTRTARRIADGTVHVDR